MLNYKSKKLHTYNGRLIYNPIAEYELVYPGGMVNISSILSKVYYSPISNKIHIKIMNGSKTLFNEEGYLLLKPDKFGVHAYHINGECLDLVLFNHTNDFLDIEIVAEVLDEVVQGEHNYDKQQSAK